jgi:hypothetical protein
MPLPNPGLPRNIHQSPGSLALKRRSGESTVAGELTMREEIEVGFQVFVNDAPEEFGAVRAIAPDGRKLTVYVENAGDFTVPASAVLSVQSEKVAFDCGKLDPKLRAAIGHAHDREDS